MKNTLIVVSKCPKYADGKHVNAPKTKKKKAQQNKQGHNHDQD